GLGIGRLVFGALNKVEWVFMLAMLGTVLSDGTWKLRSAQLMVVLLVLLLLQTFWLLPRLDVRAEAYMSGATLPPSYPHFYYVGRAIVKVSTLVIYGVLVFLHLSPKGPGQRHEPRQATTPPRLRAPRALRRLSHSDRSPLAPGPEERRRPPG